jgi:hypothetical protein
MATVTNMSDQAISIPIKGETAVFLPPHMRVQEGSNTAEEVHPDSTKPISEQAIRAWLKHPLNQAAVHDNKIKVDFDGDGEKTAAQEPAAAKPAAGAPKPVTEHWKTTVRRVADITDIDTLEAMYATEERKQVKEALDKRMEMLSV